MPNLSIPRPPDPRPSQAEPKQRGARKKLEKKHGGFEWVPYLGLALTGLVLAFDVKKDVKKCEERKGRQEQDPRRDRRGESSHRLRSMDSRTERDQSTGRDRHHGGSDYGHDRFRERGRKDDERERPRLESSPRDYDYYGPGRRDYEPWSDQRRYSRRSTAW